MPGKPFPKVSEAQRAAFTATALKDLVRLGKHLGGAAVEHLQQTPDSVITQTVVAIERDTGAVTAVVRGVSTLFREREAAKARQAAEAANGGPRVVDAEFVDE